jgi:hypothetical protein
MLGELPGTGFSTDVPPTGSARRFYADEAKVRRSFRATGVIGMAVGMFILGVEVAALVTGNVS